MDELTEGEPDAGGARRADRPATPARRRARGEAAEAASTWSPALRHLLRSRDLCPLRARPTWRSPNTWATSRRPSPREAYLERAKLLAPDDPELWYRCGTLELADGRPDRAWASWRRSLELSDRHLPEILDGASPPSARATSSAASSRTTRPADGGGSSTPDRARGVGPSWSGPWPSSRAGPDRRGRGTASGRRSTGPSAGRQRPWRRTGRPWCGTRRLDWRLELAELAYEQGRFEEAHQELLTILALQPGNAQARKRCSIRWHAASPSIVEIFAVNARA